VDAGRRWGSWAEDRHGPIPDLLPREWKILRDAIDGPLTELSQAHDWRLCSALLTLHAMADEACAGLGVALDASHGGGVRYRVHGRELLARSTVRTSAATTTRSLLRPRRTASSATATTQHGRQYQPGHE